MSGIRWPAAARRRRRVVVGGAALGIAAVAAAATAVGAGASHRHLVSQPVQHGRQPANVAPYIPDGCDAGQFNFDVNGLDIGHVDEAITLPAASPTLDIRVTPVAGAPAILSSNATAKVNPDTGDAQKLAVGSTLPATGQPTSAGGLSFALQMRNSTNAPLSADAYNLSIRFSVHCTPENVDKLVGIDASLNLS